MPNVVKITTPKRWLDLLIPHYCQMCGAFGSVLCECCKNYNTRSIKTFGVKNVVMLARELGVQKSFVFGDYSGKLAKLIELYKFKACRDLASPFAEFLSEALPVGAAWPKNIIIVPVPTVARHIRERGFDHTKRLARELATIRKCACEELLQRKTSAVQVGANAETRREQAKTAFELKPRAKARINREAVYLLLDDVCTTGATLSQSAAALKRAGAKKLWTVCLARHGGRHLL